jgi:nitrate/nitrite transport system substrate-binding protein
VDQKIEGVHAAPWTLEAASAPLTMGPDRFLDGRVFDPDDPIGYLEHTEISAMRVRLDDLAWMNA